MKKVDERQITPRAVAPSAGISALRLQRWDDQAQRYVVDPGAYELRIGATSDAPVLLAPLQVVRP